MSARKLLTKPPQEWYNIFNLEKHFHKLFTNRWPVVAILILYSLMKGEKTMEYKALSRRQFLRVASTALASMVIAACGATPTPTPPPKPTEKPAQPQQPTPKPPAAPISLVAIYWSPTPEYIAYREECAKRMNDKFPGQVNASQVSVPVDQYGEKVLTMIAGGTPPDVLQLNFKWEPYFRANDAVQDLGPLADADKEFSFADFYKLLVDLTRKGGKIYSIPKGWNPFVVYYNKTMFKAAGLPEIPRSWEDTTWTWDAFLQAARKLTVDKNSDGKTDTFGVYLPYWYVFVHSNGADVLTPDDKAPAFDKPEFVEALQFVADLRLKHKVSPTAAEIAGQGSDQDLFVNQRIAMLLAGAWPISRFSKITDFEWEIGVLPRVPGKPPVSYTQYFGHGIPKGAKNTKWSWEYVKVISDEESNIGAAKMGYDVPAMIKVAESKHFGAAPPPPTRKVLLDAAPYIKVWPTIPPIREIIDGMMQPEFDLAFSGDQTVKQAIDKALPKVKARLEEYWKGK